MNSVTVTLPPRKRRARPELLNNNKLIPLAVITRVCLDLALSV
jgi:hypothetical protein